MQPTIRCICLLVAGLFVTVAPSPAAPDISMVRVAGGCYQMGDSSGNGEKDERPVHEVCINDFQIGLYEVTQAQWEAVMGNNPSQYKSGGSYPVEMVSWNDVQKFITRLNTQTGRSYRLPTEAEWEYAARSRGHSEMWSGTNDPKQLFRYMNFCDKNCEATYKDRTQDDGYGLTAPAGSFRPNALGLYDMSGNVWEWCQDWFDANYYRRANKNNPKGPEAGTFKVIRGGSWDKSADLLRAASRDGYLPDDRFGNHGFRLALSITQ